MGLQWYNIYKTGNSILVNNNDLHHLFLNFFCIQEVVGTNSGQAFNAPGWFVSVIFVCYIIFYILAKKSENFSLGCCVMILVGIVLVYSHPFEKFPFLNFTMGRGYLAFFCGVLLAKYYQKRKKWENVILGSALICLWLIANRYNLLGNLITTWVIYFCTGVMLIAVNSEIINKVLGLGMFQRLGKLSFSIYLWNFPTDIVFNMVNGYYNIFDFSKFTCWFIHLMISLGIVIISSVLVEPVIGRKIESLFMKGG